ncbi:MAG: hypothetical protein ACE5MB_04775 [Anaerolineae bacterium]
MGRKQKLNIPRGFSPDQAPDFVDQVKAELSLPPNSELKLRNLRTSAHGERVIEYIYSRPVKLEGPEYAEASGVVVDVPSTVSLRFNGDGELVASQLSEVDEDYLNAITDQVRKLVANDQIYFSKPGEEIDVNSLIAEHKPYYTTYDQDGNLRIKRAFIDSKGIGQARS